MGLRIAFDLDGVLADMEGELVRQAQELFGERIADRTRDSDPPADPDGPGAGTVRRTPDESATLGVPDAVDDPLPLQRLRLTPRETRRLWRHVAKIDGFWESLREIEDGGVARLASLAAERRWELVFLTRRPECAGATAQVQTQRWLEQKGFPLPSVFVVQNSRGRIAAALALDVVVDDRPENCLDVAVDSSARAVLVWRDDAGPLPAAARQLGIAVVRSVAESLDLLGEIELTRADAGVVGRVRRMFRRKLPAGM